MYIWLSQFRTVLRIKRQKNYILNAHIIPRNQLLLRAAAKITGILLDNVQDYQHEFVIKGGTLLVESKVFYDYGGDESRIDFLHTLKISPDTITPLAEVSVVNNQGPGYYPMIGEFTEHKVMLRHDRDAVELHCLQQNSDCVIVFTEKVKHIRDSA